MQPALIAAFIGGLGGLIVETLQGPQPTIAGVARVAAEGVALGFCLYGRRSVLAPAILAVVLLPFAGHAAQVNPSGGAIFADAVHVLSAGVWAGGILVLSYQRPPDGWKGEAGRAMLQRFGRVAFLAFAVTALTGAIRATQALGEVSDLWGTPYGLVLTAKSAAVLVMVVMSAIVWRRGLRYASAEGVVVLIVLAATALLAAFPIPHGQA